MSERIIKTEELARLIKASLALEICKELVRQIEISDYTDSEGHKLKMNVHYKEAKEALR